MVIVGVIDARQVRFEHSDLTIIAKSAMAKSLLGICTVDRDRMGVLFVDGR